MGYLPLLWHTTYVCAGRDPGGSSHCYLKDKHCYFKEKRVFIQDRAIIQHTHFRKTNMNVSQKLEEKRKALVRKLKVETERLRIAKKMKQRRDDQERAKREGPPYPSGTQGHQGTSRGQRCLLERHMGVRRGARSGPPDHHRVET